MTVSSVIPGEIVPVDGTITLNLGRDRIEVIVENAGDRPIQVGSHYHFAAVNPALSFDRVRAHGYRLDIPAGTSVRFEPGLSRAVSLVDLAGRRTVPGLRPEYAGPLNAGPLDAGPFHDGPFDAASLEAGSFDDGPFDPPSFDSASLDFGFGCQRSDRT